MLDEKNLAKLVDILKIEEGFSPAPYLCSQRRCTIGYGTNLEAWPAFIKTFSLPIYDDVVKGGFRGQQLMDKLKKAGMRWSEIKAESALEAVLAVVTEGLFKGLPWVNDLAASREGAFMDMAYNMGLPKLLGFKKTLAFAQAGDWNSAADEMLRSTWAAQVGGRAIRISNWMRTGEIV